MQPGPDAPWQYSRLGQIPAPCLLTLWQPGYRAVPGVRVSSSVRTVRNVKTVIVTTTPPAMCMCNTQEYWDKWPRHNELQHFRIGEIDSTVCLQNLRLHKSFSLINSAYCLPSLYLACLIVPVLVCPLLLLGLHLPGTRNNSFPLWVWEEQFLSETPGWFVCTVQQTRGSQTQDQACAPPTITVAENLWSIFCVILNFFSLTGDQLLLGDV